MQAVEQRLRSEAYGDEQAAMWQELLSALPDERERMMPTPPPPSGDIVIGVENDDDLVSHQSGTGTLQSLSNPISCRADATISRAFMTVVRGNRDGASLPNFTLISLDRANVPPSPREQEHLSLMVAGSPGSSRTVWHEVSSGTTLLPGVCVDFVDATPCRFCPTRGTKGTPVIHLKHVASFDATEQRIYLAVYLACARCARRRAPALRDLPLATVNYVFLQERLTMHLHYTVTHLRPLFDRLRLVQDDDAVACDACNRSMTHSDDILTVVAQRRDASEIAVFTVCSDNCRAQIRDYIQSATDASIAQPRPSRPSDSLDGSLTTLPAKSPKKKSPRAPALPTPDEVPIAQWRVLADAEFSEIARDGPSGLSRIRTSLGAPLIHHCRQAGCFCRGTHRGLYRAKIDSAGKGKEKQPAGESVPDHYVLQAVYDKLRLVHLYTDILGTSEQTCCLACKKPTTSFCSECLAVRSCATNECRQKSLALHVKLCRPYREAWTPLALV